MKAKLMRILQVVLLVEVGYLVLINAALNLPFTQTLVNQMKPDKFYVTWNSAWSLYPFRVHARGVAANGQSRGQQWQAQVPAVSASISVVPLMWRSVKLHGVVAEDVAYRQRPRPRAGRDYSEIRAYFPPIEGRELETEAVEEPPRKPGKKPWDIRIENIRVHGSHDVWFRQTQGKLAGELRADLSYRTVEGVFSLSDGELDVELESLIFRSQHRVIREGRFAGRLEFKPFVPRQHKGIQSVAFLSVDAELRTETEALKFLNVYLSQLHGMEIDGTGLLQGRLQLQQGRLLPGTDIRIAARELSLDLLDWRFEGEGNIGIQASDSQDQVEAVIQFSGLNAFDRARDALLFDGEGLVVNATGSPLIVPIENKRFEASRLTVAFGAVKVPDLQSFQAYMPKRWPIRLHGGQGQLQGNVGLTKTGFNVDLRLTSEAADVGIVEYRFRTNLDTAIKLDYPAIGSGVDLSGSYVHLDNARLSNDLQQTRQPWSTSVDVVRGKLQLQLPEGIPVGTDFRELYTELQGTEIVPLLHSGGKPITLNAGISDLSWLNLLFKNRFDLAIAGSGDVTADIVVSQGLPAPGTRLAVHPEKLGVEVLDYAAEGDGAVTLALQKGDEATDLNLEVSLDNANMKRKDEETAFIENVAIRLQALERKVVFDGKPGDMELHLKIPSARIRDMSVYNLYLPENTPLQFTGGHAELLADIALTSDSAKGYVKLLADAVAARIDEQQVSGRLSTDIALQGGVPEKMDFDISGSTITLDDVRVMGKEKDYDEENWSARFELKKGRAQWLRPIRMEVEADLQMTNSKPIVALIANQRGKHGWLEKALTIDDVEGEARMNVEQNRIVIPYAFAGSDKIDVGAKGVITPDRRDGVLYVRFRKLHGILKIENGRRNLDVLNAKRTFDLYDTNASLDNTGSDGVSAAAFGAETAN